MSAWLLDGNVLAALGDSSHVHHEAAHDWLASHDMPFATCPITQGTLMRLLLMNDKGAVTTALRVLQGFTGNPRHRFWSDDLGYGDIAWRGVLGHRQVTDAYLAALARHRGGKLATLDRGLAALHTDVAVLIET